MGLLIDISKDYNTGMYRMVKSRSQQNYEKVTGVHMNGNNT